MPPITRISFEPNTIELAGYILEYRDNALWIMTETDGVRSVVGMWSLGQSAQPSAPVLKGAA